jgi:hypothetical protein
MNMKSSKDIERVLERFGSAWPDDGSVVDRVMHEIQSTPVVTISPNRRRILMKSLIGIAASLAIVALLWWGVLSDRNSLYAQVIDAARKAQTIHITHYGQLKGEAKPTKIWESWYESGVGFRRDVCDWHHTGRQRTVCLGNRDDTWTLASDRKNTVMHSHGRDITKETEQIFTDIDRPAHELQNNGRRYPEGDQTFDGRPCKAYLLTKSGQSDVPSKADKLRQLFYLDQQSRLVRLMSQVRDGNGWNATQFSTFGYDEPLGSAFFQPNFGKDFKIVDADAKPVKSQPTNPEGPVLTYHVDPKSKSARTTAVDMDKLLEVVNARLNAGSEKLAVVRNLDDQRIEVALMQEDGADRQRVERQLTRPGTLEFRILANNILDKTLIDRAKNDPAGTEVLDSSGKRLAWWVPVKAGSERELSRPEIVRRTKKTGNREVAEILVVADPCNVTGDYLKDAKLQFDSFGNPGVSFTFTDAGGRLFGKLTGDHLATESHATVVSTSPSYNLAIIIDGEVFSAPTIRSKITAAGQITGSFNEMEAADIAAVLNAGSLPARLRLIGESPHSK